MHHITSPAVGQAWTKEAVLYIYVRISTVGFQEKYIQFSTLNIIVKQYTGESLIDM